MIGALVTCLTVLIGVNWILILKKKKKMPRREKKINFLCGYYLSETQTTIGLFLGTFFSTLFLYMIIDLMFGTIYLNTYNSKWNYLKKNIINLKYR